MSIYGHIMESSDIGLYNFDYVNLLLSENNLSLNKYFSDDNIIITESKINFKKFVDKIKLVIDKIKKAIKFLINKIKAFLSKFLKNNKKKDIELPKGIKNIKLSLPPQQMVSVIKKEDSFPEFSDFCNDLDDRFNELGKNFDTNRSIMIKNFKFNNNKFDNFNLNQDNNSRSYDSSSNNKERSVDEIKRLISNPFNNVSENDIKKCIKYDIDKYKEKYGISGFNKFIRDNSNTTRVSFTDTVLNMLTNKNFKEYKQYELELIEDWKKEYLEDLEKRYDEEQKSHDKVIEEFVTKIYNIINKSEIWFDANDFVDMSALNQFLSININNINDITKYNSVIKTGIVAKAYVNAIDIDYSGYQNVDSSDITKSANLHLSVNDIKSIIEKHKKSYYNNYTIESLVNYLNEKNVSGAKNAKLMQDSISKFDKLIEKCNSMLNNYKNDNNDYQYISNNNIRIFSSYISAMNNHMNTLSAIVYYIGESMRCSQSALNSIQAITIEMNKHGYDSNTFKRTFVTNDFGYKISKPKE